MKSRTSARLQIIPFSEIWFDCRYNMLISILQTYDYSFHNKVIENAYQYVVETGETQNGNIVNYLICEPTMNIDSFFSQKPIFESRDMMKDKLIGYIFDEIQCGNYIMAGVDLFNWIPSSMTFRKYHWQHYTLVSGIDISEGCVYVLDAAKEGYGEYKIAIDVFVECVYASTYEYKLYRICINRNMNFDTDVKKRVHMNSKKIIECIDAICDTVLWQLADEDYDTHEYEDLCAMYINRIIHRQKANRLFLETIGEKNAMKTFCQFFLNAEKNWREVQVIFLRNYYGLDRALRMERLNQRVYELLDSEKKIWEEIQAMKWS